MFTIKQNDKVQSVERAIDLLYCFSLQQPELALQDFIDKTGLKKTTVFRILNSLKTKGLIIKNESTGTYKLGIPLLGLSQIVSEGLDVRQEALPIMKMLSTEIKETVSLNIIQAKHRVCIEKVEGQEDIRQFIKLGYPYPILRGASGKILIAYSDQVLLDELINDWNEFNEIPIKKVQLEEELKKIRLDGYSFSKNERAVGAYSISAPIFNVNNQLIAGLSVSGLTTRLTAEDKQIYIQKLKKASYEISKQMGYIK
ncbi:IclR family transcriptional regulator [Alkalihalobacillus sp. BA299]|uniref:IclR family transcriptional regulator n=1 Tax=Alkalihalobacillus sp. BA299 TaxID=2815938 RepID=UPI001ADA78D4|nr:IclR family transcriptional regulator [Alkalihalobacillus sp. BA299]